MRDLLAFIGVVSVLVELGEGPPEPRPAGLCSANALYDLGRQGFLGGDNDWDSDHRVILIDAADYTKDLAAHDFLNDVAAGARVSTTGALANPTKAAGVADADDTVFTSVTGDPSEQLIIYQHTGTESTSDLVANIDTATGLPVTPNGANINLTFDSGANKIFKL
jgi:hypothetical protein